MEMKIHLDLERLSGGSGTISIGIFGSTFQFVANRLSGGIWGNFIINIIRSKLRIQCTSGALIYETDIQRRGVVVRH